MTSPLRPIQRRPGTPRTRFAGLLAGSLLATSLLAGTTQARPMAAPQRATQAEAERGIVVTDRHRAAVEAGLAWLANQQNTDGSWTAKIGYKLNNGYNHTADGRGHVGVTALSGIAFLGGGHRPGRGKYGDVVDRCLDFVLSCVDDDGYINHAGTRMYSHAFATLFLAEIYGMTHREDVREKLQKAVDFIVKSQNKDGGWRYVPYASEADMSIVVCQVLALRAARNIGIRVQKATVDRAARYVVASAVGDANMRGNFGFGGFRNEAGTFHYQKDVHSRSSFPLTAAGVTALHGVGIYSDDAIQLGLKYLQNGHSRFNAEHGHQGHYFFWYGHYYAVQAMYQAGGNYWELYFEEIRDFLLRLQREDGSFPNRVGPGDAFGTAAGVLILEIPYRFLPIFQR